MIEYMDWLIISGIGVAIFGIYVLARKLEKHSQDTTEVLMYISAVMLDELKRLTGARMTVPEPTVGVILDRRGATRRAQVATLPISSYFAEQRKLAGRRKNDFLPDSIASCTRS